MTIDNLNTTILCPANDGESLTITKIARNLSYDLRVSSQDWGAVLSEEPEEAFTNLKENIVIIEIPGLEKERALRKSHTLFIIDHHRYQGLDRYNEKSSLEQFADLIGYRLDRWELGVALNDRGYIHALREGGYSNDEIREIRRFDLSAQGYRPEDLKRLSEIYKTGYVLKNHYIIETEERKTACFADLLFLENEQDRAENLFVLVYEQKSLRGITFYGNPRIAETLFKNMGGFCGGSAKHTMYWGKDFGKPFSRNKILTMIQAL